MKVMRRIFLMSVTAGAFAMAGCNRATPPSTGAANVPATPPGAFLGILTTGTYPTDGCRITKTGSMIYAGSSGWATQPEEAKKDGYTVIISDEESLWRKLENQAVQNGFNAVLGYRYDVYGGFTAYGGSVINGDVGLGAYDRVARGTPVVVQCGR